MKSRTSDVIKIIDEALPRGYKTQIQKLAGVSRPTVVSFFQGKNVNKKVLEATITYFIEYKKEQQSYLDRIKAIN
ncbi:MAG: hypothetical protein NTW49_02895 [Bacteroidia bacterium]|nr:hypothetical protein [Bacteroidia bacterium]